MWLLCNRLVTSDGHTANCRSVDCFVLHLKELKAETLQKVFQSCAPRILVNYWYYEVTQLRNVYHYCRLRPVTFVTLPPRYLPFTISIE